ncbi:MAG: Ig-like domain-containing protein [Proteobacteria bacterium]|nr:Ig-like domain-containing protein [Pseudomonadota bacterium]
MLTATVVDANGFAVSGATVRFAVKSGSGHFLTASSGPSSAGGGIVTISYSALSASGTANQTDHTDIVSAEVVGTGVTGEIAIPVTASSLSLLLGASTPSIKTDGSNSTTITASVVDSLRAPVSGQKVLFTAPTGLLGTSSGDSKADGTVTIPLTALALGGKADRTNRTEVVTASVVGTSVSAQIPIQITGSTLTVAASKNTAQVGDILTLTVTANDAASAGVNAQAIKLSIDNKSTGAGSLSATSVTTSVNGNTPSVTLTVTAPGSVIVNADWVNAAGNSTVTTSTAIVATSVGIPFAVTAPTTNPTSLALSASQAISLSVPASISGVTVTNVRFATTLGTWSNSSKSSTAIPSANAVTEILTAGINSGNANVQIDALDGSGNVLATLNRLFALSAATGTKISLQPSVSIVSPSTGGTTNSATLTATVRDAANNTVGNAPVLFEIVNPTGSGEQINPVVVYTNSNGLAATTFTSGSLSTVGGLQVKASLVGTAVTDTKTINVSGTSASLTLGRSSGASSTDNGTTYTLPMTVLVVSSTGGAVAGATVTLTAFPTHYYRGYRIDKKTDPSYCGAVHTKAKRTIGPVIANVTTDFPNEDVNENDILDDGEDYDPNGDGGGLGSITPPHASAGTLPPSVATNANGVGSFNLIYLKSYAHWVESRIRAKVVVNGTESVNEFKFVLIPTSADMSPDCFLPDSPFGADLDQKTP